MRIAATLALALFLGAAPASANEAETSLVKRVSAAMVSKDVGQIASLVGRSGARILTFGIDALPPASPRHVFAKRLRAVLGASSPVCVGYNVGSDKTVLFFSAAGLDWSKGGLDAEDTGMLAMHFYRPRTPHAPARLLWVTPITWEDIRLFGDYSSC